MRVAVIDLGTNTFNLLIAELNSVNFDVLHSDKVGVAIGMGGINENRISDDAWERSLNALISFKRVCDSYDVIQIRAIGTSAIRSASNSSEYIASVYKETGINIEIVSGLEEAALVYDGVRWFYDFKKPAVIMDIGGGSTEFISANEFGVLKAMSIDIGVSRIYQSLDLSDPFSESDIENIENWLEKHAAGQLDDIHSDLLIGASGTFETFYELQHKIKFPSSLEVIPLKREDLEKSIDSIISSTLKERELNEFIVSIRTKMAPIAAVKTRWVMNKLNVKDILISPCSLKEGALRGKD